MLNLMANRFRLLRYFSARILNIFTSLMIFSMLTLTPEIRLLCLLSSLVNGFFLLLFLGSSLLS